MKVDTSQHGCIELPDIEGFRPVRDDYTAGFANGVEAVRDWLRAMPKHDALKTPKDLASILDDMIDLRSD